MVTKATVLAMEKVPSDRPTTVKALAAIETSTKYEASGILLGYDVFHKRKHTYFMESVIPYQIAERAEDSIYVAPHRKKRIRRVFHHYMKYKIIGEFHGNYYFARHDVPFIKARFQNVYGPGEILGAGRWRGTPATVWRNVTPTFIWKALHGEAVPVEHGGVATRDFIYVEDIVEGLVRCALAGTPGGVYNLASGVETSIRELAELINELTGNATPIDLKPARNWDRSGKRSGDPAKAASELGFSAEVGLRDGLRRTVAWMRDNAPVIERCIAQHRPFMPELRPAAE